MGRALKASIDRQALQHNLARVRAVAPGKSIIAMIKANGYGHGIVNVAKSLIRADAFGVACIEEALQLRKTEINNRIILMEGFFQAREELPEIVHNNLEVVIHHPNQVTDLKHHSDYAVNVWVKFNSGMHRLGFPLELAAQVFRSLEECSNVKIQGIMTHFAKADELDSSKTQEQMTKFYHTMKPFSFPKSLANSAGIIGWPDSHADWVRPGIMLYGVSPFEGRVGTDEGLKPVMTLSSEIIALQNPKKGEEIGYGGTFTCKKDMQIGIVAVGYGDGYPRIAPNGTPVLVNDQLAPIVGRVSMDMISVDLSNHKNVKVGDAVELWGKSLPVEIVAKSIGTTAYELLTGLSTRVHFSYPNYSHFPSELVM